MKKIKPFHECDFSCLTKTFRIMRITLFLMLAVILQTFANEAYSQKTMLSLDYTNTRLEVVLDEIEDLSEFFFLANEKLVDLDRSVNISVENKKIDEILDMLFADTDVVYTITDRKIILAPSFLIEDAQQQRSVSGKVTDSGDQPLPGVTVIVKGSTQGTVTNADGDYNLPNVPDDATLVFSFMGMRTVEVIVGNQTTVNTMLEEETIGLEEVVAIGYGSQLKRTVTGAITSVREEDIEAPNAVSADNLLQGKVAGLTINQNSAQPGSSMSVNIRGRLSPRGSNSPLYVIDGVVISSEANKAVKLGPTRLMDFSLRDGSNRSPLASINPNDIASIDILKDASAAAIYGSAAANGVILITTKKGQTGTPTVNYNGSISTQNIRNYYEMLDAQEFMNLSNLGSKERWLYDKRYAPYGTEPAPSSGWPIQYTKEQLTQTESYDHFKEVTRTGIIHDHNISLSAGSENIRLYSSFNYFDQKSLMKTSDFSRISGRINYEQKFNNWLKLNINSMYTVIEANNPSMGHWRENANEANETNSALYFSPRLPLMDENGDLTLPENALSANPLKFRYIKDKTTTKRLFFTPSLEIKIAPWLSGNVQLSIDETAENRDVFSPKKSRMPQQIQENFGSFADAYNNNYSIEEYLTVNKKFLTDHEINAVIGTGYYIAKGNSYGFAVFNLPTDALENSYLQLSSDVENTEYRSHKWERNKLSYFGRFNYSFKNKYILGSTLRRDGSSAFAENHKWGWFPGLSAAWIISSEKFMKNLNWINYLKFRSGFGTSGNESILTGNNYSLTTYGIANSGGWFYFNNELTNGIIQKQKGNKNLKWETDITFNVGLDYSLLDNRISGNLDYYIRTAKDLLDFATLPSPDFVHQLAKNVGKTRSQGIELAFNGEIIKTRDFDWNAYLNLSHNRSYWVERNPEVEISPWIDDQDDLSPIYGWKTDGIFSSLEEVQQYTSNGQVLQPEAFPGNLKFVDINGDGKLDDDDITRFGTWDPFINYGFGTNLRYRNWQLGISTYGVINQKMKNGWGYRGLIEHNHLNTSVQSREIWTSFNPEGWWPGIAPNYAGNDNKSGFDDFTLKNVSYMRFKDIKITYTLPEYLLHQMNIPNFSLYADLQNSLLLTNYVGLDPEMEHNSAPFPLPLTIVFGVNVTF